MNHNPHSKPGDLVAIGALLCLVSGAGMALVTRALFRLLTGV